MAKKKKKKKVDIPAEPRITEGQWYWCVNCGHHGDYGFHRKKNVKCEMCNYEDVSLYTKEEINDEWLDNVWLERFKTKKQADQELKDNPPKSFLPNPFSIEDKVETKTESKTTKEKSLADQLAEIKKL